MKKNCFKAICCLLVLAQAGGFVFAAKKTSKNSKTEKTAATKESTPMPEWVNNVASVYPSKDYFSAVGTGSNRNAAEVSAAKNIASIFGQSIKSELKTTKKMTQATVSGKIETSSNAGFSQSVSTSVDMDALIGVEIKEYWKDEKANEWYSLAILEKVKTANIYCGMINKNVTAVNSLLEGAESDRDSMEGYASYDFAQDIVLYNDKLIKNLAVISPQAAASVKKPVLNAKEIAQEKLKIANAIPISVSIEGDDDAKIANAFKMAIGKLGFKATNDSSRYALTGELLCEQRDSDSTVQCHYTVSARITDTETGNQMVPFNAKGRKSGKNMEDAKRLAITDSLNKIDSGFVKAFEDFLKNTISE